MKTFSIRSMGCKVNQYDGQLLREHFLAAGYAERSLFWRKGDDEVDEDVFVLNSCTVTEQADKECARLLRKVRRLRPHTKIIVTGCAVTAKDQELRKTAEVDLMVGNNQKSRLLDLYAMAMGRDSHRQPPAPTHIEGFQGHCRAFVKIQDGCNEFCSFCKIPFVRGRNRSRTLQDIQSEVKSLVSNGYQEIVLTGVHAGNYGLDLGSPGGLADLVGAIDAMSGLRRIRFSSVEPMNLSDDLIRRLSAFPKVCPHFHLPLQSGDDTLLKSMKRRYTAQRYRTSVELLRTCFEDVEVTTDIIVGFPGETDQLFENTLAMVREMGFLKVHVFPYSVRPGTLAAGFADRVPEAMIRARCETLSAEADKVAQKRRISYLGRVMPVLMEGKVSRGLRVGLTANYLKVVIPQDLATPNSLVEVQLSSDEGYALRGIPAYADSLNTSLPIGY